MLMDLLGIADPRNALLSTMPIVLIKRKHYGLRAYLLVRKPKSLT